MANSKAIRGFITGLSIGVVVGILIAPDKGQLTRKKIADKSKDLTDLVKDSVFDFIDKLQKGVDKEINETQQITPKMSGDV